MGEIDEPQNAVNHGISNGYERIQAPEGYSVDELLQKNR
jgi:hypothetical protein